MSFGRIGKPREHRRSPRHTAESAAEIVLANGRRIPCRIVDRSGTGARLAFGSVLGITDSFHLVDRSSRTLVEVVRREPRAIAVHFVGVTSGP
jgi:hypothetical protein